MIAISSKHTLALCNRGNGTTTELVALAREIAGGVRDAFGVQLVPEPVFVGHRWKDVAQEAAAASGTGGRRSAAATAAGGDSRAREAAAAPGDGW